MQSGKYRKLGRANVAAATAFVVAAIFSNDAALAQAPPADQKPAPAAVDRTKMLTSPGVIGVFSTYKVRPDIYRMTATERRGMAAEVQAVAEKHKEKVIVDAYLTRGLSAKSDLLLRVHANDAMAAQAFLVDFRATRFGVGCDVTESLVGITKPLNYITKDKSATLNAGLSSASYTGDAPRYAIMIPIKKSAEWWNM